MPKYATAKGFGRKRRKAVFCSSEKQIPLSEDDSATTSQSAATTSTSKRKLDLFLSHSDSSSNNRSDQLTSSYRVIDMNILKKMIGALACPDCGGSEINLHEDSQEGLASKLKIDCATCDSTLFSNFTSIQATDSRSYDINQRFVFACKANGLGYEQAKSFCAHLDLQSPISDTAFHNKLPSLYLACEQALAEHMTIIHELVRAEHIRQGYAKPTDDFVDITVSFDGTWQKRGHTSHNGIGIAIDILTGYVVDFEVLSNICVACERDEPKDDLDLQTIKNWIEKHKPFCEKNYSGSSNAMEVESAKRIWTRSVNNKSKLRYITMLSDGDSKAFDAVRSMKPYGENVDISKEECINHVSKRLRAGLEGLKKKGGPGGMSLSGRGMLSEPTINYLKSLYHKAIKQNAGNIENMQREIMAAPYHITSTDAEPDHRFCPDDSWCWYRDSVKKNRKEGHRPDLPKGMLSVILPVYKRLSTPELMARCARVSTQNANECVNGVIWKRCPKTQWLGKRSIVIGATMGVITFNGGEAEISRVATKFGMRDSIQLEKHARKKDEGRSNRVVVSSSKRRSRAHRQITERQHQTRKEGVTYAAGKFGA